MTAKHETIQAKIQVTKHGTMQQVVQKIEQKSAQALAILTADHDIYCAMPEDLADIVCIYNQNIAQKQATADLQPVSIAQRQAWFDAHYLVNNRPIFVVKNHSGKMVAWGSFSNLYDRPAYHISSEISIYVDKDSQRQGLAKQLVLWMLAIAPELGIHNVVALIFAHNQPSIRLFQSLGFSQWGQMPQVCDMQGFYADVIMLGKAVISPV
ncbi:GNAT family N-acetyltransferase [Psychrobacter sp. I-STPA6b]|uniref:GNAT family N-acetyltransferase n=1 Tax=Psychrobacter sp. I-STPA6b TaxID=2585718 RepID=UPI00222397C0|nr:GNAT family N-acetyltransferase [Psychrobacter sp. I-STPA6b]